jgi:hypothetical protein
MKLVIELTNGIRNSCGDCECVSEMIAGVSKIELEQEFNRRMPEYYFEDLI